MKLEDWNYDGDPGGVTSFEYNTEDDLTATTDPLGNETTFELDAIYRPVSVTDANGGEWSRTYDPVGNLLASVDPLGATTGYAYDGVGRLTTTTDALGAATTMEFDALGRTVTETDALGQTVSYEYDVLDRLTTVSDQTGETTSYGYDDRGNLTEQVDRRGNSTEYSYDAASQLTSWSGPLGTGGSYTYDSRGNTIASTDALGRTSTLVYDALSRPVAAADPLGNTSTVGYDPMGRVVASTDPNGNVTTLDYDLAGRLTASIDPLGNTTTQGWDAAGNRTSTTDANGVKTAYSYDPLGRTTSETNPLGKTWRYEYDALGRQVKEVDAKNQTTTYQYTPRSDVAVIDHPTEVNTTFSYDAAQNLITMTDGLGASGWVFDAAGRLTKQTDSLGKKLTYEYDTTGAQTALTLPGGNSVTYEYDDAGRPVLQSSPWGELAYGYDAASNLSTVLRSTGVTTDYGYDADNRVTDITHTSPGAELGCDLGANDLEVGAGVNIDELIGLDLCVTVDIDIPVLTGLDYGDTIDLDYSYDPVGNVTSQTRKDGSAPAVSTTYGYDKLNRLTSSAGPTSNTYKYDKAGNRTQWITNRAPDTGKALTVNASYDGAGQLTSEAKTRPALLGTSTVNTAYTYDANGNRTKSQTGLSPTTYKYTDDDKVAEVNQAGRKVTTGYDGIGRALTTTTQSLLILASTTTQVWDGYDVVQQSGPSGVSNLVRDVAGDVAIQTADGLLSGGDRWGLTDRLGSTIAQTSGSRVGQLAKYSDWGIPTFASVGVNSATGYTGELTDTTAGINHYYARSYEPTSGWWLTADPYRGTLDSPNSLNRHTRRREPRVPDEVPAERGEHGDAEGQHPVRDRRPERAVRVGLGGGEQGSPGVLTLVELHTVGSALAEEHPLRAALQLDHEGHEPHQDEHAADDVSGDVLGEQERDAESHEQDRPAPGGEWGAEALGQEEGDADCEQSAPDAEWRERGDVLGALNRDLVGAAAGARSAEAHDDGARQVQQREAQGEQEPGSRSAEHAGEGRLAPSTAGRHGVVRHGGTLVGWLPQDPPDACSRAATSVSNRLPKPTCRSCTTLSATVTCSRAAGAVGRPATRPHARPSPSGARRASAGSTTCTGLAWSVGRMPELSSARRPSVTSTRPTSTRTSDGPRGTRGPGEPPSTPRPSCSC
ncbi:hypothetical protein BH10ACT7_BH10ACT7_07930 [soil metagenome]